MFIKSILLAAAMATSLIGCAAPKMAIIGQTSNGTPMAGESVANWDGAGTFWVQAPGGARCSGKYDSLTHTPSMVVPVRCTDGRTGQAIIARQANMMGGTVISELDDGTRAQFVFGNLTYEQAYGAGGVARTQG